MPNTSETIPLMSADTLEALPIGAAFVDTKGLVKYTNPKFREIFQVGDKVIVGQHIHKLLCQKLDSHPKNRCIFLHRASQSPVFRQPIVVNDLEGNKIWIEYSAYPVNKKDVLMGFFITFTPASLFRFAEDTYDAVKAKFRAFFETGPLAKFVIDDAIKIVDMNRHAYTMTSATELIGRSLTEFFPKEATETINNFFMKLTSSNVPSRSKLHYVDKIKHKYFEVFFHPNFLPGYHAASLFDVSATEEERRRHNLFLSTVGHELKNPIAVIKAYSQMLIQKFTKTGEDAVVKHLKTIDIKTDILTKLINDLVDGLMLAAERIKLVYSRVDIDELVKNTIEEHRRTDPDHLYVIEGETKVLLRADETKIQQVIDNLLLNASKYSARGTQISVGLESDESNVVISIADQGPGIPKHEQNKVFEAYYRGKPVTSEKIHGLGLGLYICMRIVNMHNGTIWMKSKVGKGTAMYVSLPI